MPLNEAGYRDSNLTERQQHEAMESIYGLGETMTPTDLSYEDRVRMRRMLDELDQKETVGATKDFDLNKPPTAKYVFQEFPFLMYHHQSKRCKAARNHVEREEMERGGWSVDPFPAEGAELPLTAEEHAEVEEVQRKLAKKGK